MSKKERFELIYNNKLLKHSIIDNNTGDDLSFKAIVECMNNYDKFTDNILKENAQLKKTINTLQEKLDESFCQEDVEGLIKDRDITIKSLKEQLTGYQQELETYKKKPINVYQMEIRNLQVDKAELKLAIEEKDEMIKELKQVCEEYKMASPTLEDFENVQKSIRKDELHQICEKLRYYLLNHVWCDKDCRYVADIGKELDRIEKGE